MPPKKIKKKVEKSKEKKIQQEEIQEKIQEEIQEEITEIEKLIYDDLLPKHPNRIKVYNNFFNLLKEQNIIHDYKYTLDDIQKFALNIEKSIFNITVITGYGSSWNFMTQNCYTSNAVRIFTNLNPCAYLKNTNLIHRLFKKEFAEFELVNFNAASIYPEKHSEIMREYNNSQPILQKPVKIEDEPDGMHKCVNCARQKKPAYKTTYYQLQTRSAKIIGLKSILLITFWLCYWKNSYSPNKYISYLKLRC